MDEGTATAAKTRPPQASLPGDHRALEPPDPIPNSEVKRRIANGSVGYPHVRVGHRQASKPKIPQFKQLRDFFMHDQTVALDQEGTCDPGLV